MRGIASSIGLFLAACGPSVASVAIDPSTVTLTEKGKTATLKAEPKDKEGKLLVEAVLKLKWSSSDPAVATVASNGVVTAIRSGTTKVSAAVGDASGAAEVLVSIPASLALEPAGAEVVGVGKEISLSAVVKDDSGRMVKDQPVLWSTSDPKVANVDEGKITAEGEGAAQIRATLGGLSATATVTIKLPPISKLVIEPAQISFAKPGDAERLKVSATDDQGAAIKGVTPVWSTGDERVATVSETGQVQAVRRGKTKIKATAGGQTAEAEVIVK